MLLLKVQVKQHECAISVPICVVQHGIFVFKEGERSNHAEKQRLATIAALGTKMINELTVNLLRKVPYVVLLEITLQCGIRLFKEETTMSFGVYIFFWVSAGKVIRSLLIDIYDSCRNCMR